MAEKLVLGKIVQVKGEVSVEHLMCIPETLFIIVNVELGTPIKGEWKPVYDLIPIDCSDDSVFMSNDSIDRCSCEEENVLTFEYDTNDDILKHLLKINNEEFSQDYILIPDELKEEDDDVNNKLEK